MNGRRLDLVNTALRILTLLGMGILMLAAFMVWRNPDQAEGYLAAAFAALQLVISKIGEAIRTGAQPGEKADAP